LIQRSSACVSAAVSERSLANLPWAGSACQGGIRRSSSTSWIIADHPFTFAWLLIANGPMFPGLWQPTQLLRSTGATCLL
jgi:hypothetical protein